MFNPFKRFSKKKKEKKKKHLRYYVYHDLKIFETPDGYVVIVDDCQNK
jgi:hypothetical protein